MSTQGKAGTGEIQDIQEVRAYIYPSDIHRAESIIESTSVKELLIFLPIVAVLYLIRGVQKLIISFFKDEESLSVADKNSYRRFAKMEYMLTLGAAKLLSSLGGLVHPSATPLKGGKQRVFQAHEVATDNDELAVWGSQYFQVGEFVEMWADLVEKQGGKASQLYGAYSAIMDERNIPGVERFYGGLTGTGFGASRRDMEFVRREEVTVTVYVATQGQDLYISWRAFIQAHISGIKVAGLWLISWLLPLFLTLRPHLEYDRIEGKLESQWDVNMAHHIPAALGVLVALTVIVGLYGFFRRQGDLLALLRSSLNELQVDDIASLSKAVHISLMQAADKVGIDSKKLEPRQPFHTSRQRRRI